MCGIVGYSGNFAPELLGRMNAVISHRGPDDAGAWNSIPAGVGLAQRRLTIIDLSQRGHQPMWDATRTAVVVFNGEIYNYRELRESLAAEGYRFNSESDTEVVLNLYLRHGVNMLPKLNGIFAFALWDTREKTLLIARDGVGVKPMYYAETAGGLLFASELKAILQEPSVARDLDADALHYYLAYLYSPAPNTMFRSIRKLEPGHAMLVRDGKISRTWQYYDLPYDAPVESMDESEAIERVRNAVRTAVRRQMVADVPVGAFLSGGLDSSSVVHFAREFTGVRRLQCFTIDFEKGSMAKEGLTDDYGYAQRVAKLLDVDLHTVTVGPSFADHFEKSIYHLEEPQADPAAINTFFISELARKNGMKVLLSGTGGDDIFSGYRRHLALQRESLWSWLPRGLRSAIAKASSAVPNGSGFGRRLNKAFRHADLDGDERIASYFLWMDPAIITNLYGPRMREHANRLVALRPMLDALKKLPAETAPLNRMLYLDGKFFLTDHNLNYTDKMGMAAGVEIRVPLLDPDLIALATVLPPGLKQHGSVGKWIFKRAMEPFLPRDIIYRPKTGFAAPVRGWLRNELRPLLEDTLSPASLKKHGLFDPVAVERLMKRDREGTLDGSYTILAVLFVELWYRIFVEQSSPTAVNAHAAANALQWSTN